MQKRLGALLSQHFVMSEVISSIVMGFAFPLPDFAFIAKRS